MFPDIILDPTRRHDFVWLFDCTDGNPNGDPDAGNMPRTDPETYQGMVSHGALKRKIRDYVDLFYGRQAPNLIYMQGNTGEALNTVHARAYAATGRTSQGSKQNRDDVAVVRAWMCGQFFDVRIFGAVMTTQVNAGQVKGPVQVVDARSIDPVQTLDWSITRVAITREEDRIGGSREDGGSGRGKATEMGRRSLIAYGLYRTHGFFSAPLAHLSGVTQADLEIFWQAVRDVWDHDRSAARGMMAGRGVYIFSHENGRGKAHAHDLFARVRVERKPEVLYPRSFSDYAVTLDDTALPEGVTLTVIQ